MFPARCYDHILFQNQTIPRMVRGKGVSFSHRYVLVILLLFGGKKIPELMHGLGKGMKSFKKGMQEVENEMNDVKKEFENINTSEPEKK